MFEQLLQRNAVRRTGIGLVVFVLLFSGGVKNGKAETIDDLNTLKAIYDWVSSGFNYLNGVRTALDFLTGASPPTNLKLEDIKRTVVNALNERHDQDAIDGVQGLAETFSDMQKQTRLALQTGQGANTLMNSDFARTYLADKLSEIDTSANKLYASLLPVLRLASSSPENDQRVATVMPAFVILVSLRVSSLRLLSEITPWLKSVQDELISEKDGVPSAVGS
jgi:hypothetical protein